MLEFLIVLFLCRPFDLTVGHTSPHYRITLNGDLKAWYAFIEHFNGKSCFLFCDCITLESLKLYSDVAGVHGRYAAVFDHKWFSRERPS